MKAKKVIKDNELKNLELSDQVRTLKSKVSGAIRKTEVDLESRFKLIIFGCHIGLFQWF